MLGLVVGPVLNVASALVAQYQRIIANDRAVAHAQQHGLVRCKEDPRLLLTVEELHLYHTGTGEDVRRLTKLGAARLEQYRQWGLM